MSDSFPASLPTQSLKLLVDLIDLTPQFRQCERRLKTGAAGGGPSGGPRT
jgi:hypothetical protein